MKSQRKSDRSGQFKTKHVPVKPYLWILLGAVCLLPAMSGCIKMSNTYSAIPPGIWRATLTLATDSAGIADEKSGGILPWNFEVIYVSEDSFYIEILNGTERISCTEIAMGFDRSIAKDTIRIVLPVFRSYITARYEEDAMQGEWWEPSRGSHYHIPFRAYHGTGKRFEVPAGAGSADFEGRWKAMFRVETDSPYPAVAEIRQDGHEASGTIMTETGDYRYLAGNVVDDRLFLSTFDGSHAYLFEAKLLDDGTISGTYRSGNHYKTYWTAVRDEEFQLRDPHTLTQLVDSSAPVVFHLPNTSGQMVSPDDPKYAGKPKIISIFGTWCPNCMDENAFLSEYFRKHPDTGIEVISIAFERLDSARAVRAIEFYKSHFNIPWEILYGGSSHKDTVASKLPWLENFIAFPTLIFLDANNRVVKVHTGFYGPATEQYVVFVAEFDKMIAELTSYAR